MATEVVMPQMGESIAEGTITRWLKQVGERVERDENLFEITTDKVDAEIPSPAAGVLLEIRAQEGETVEVGAVVGLVGEAGEQPAAGGASAQAAQPPATPQPAAQPPSPQPPPPPAQQSAQQQTATQSSPAAQSPAAQSAAVSTPPPQPQQAQPAAQAQASSAATAQQGQQVQSSAAQQQQPAAAPQTQQASSSSGGNGGGGAASSGDGGGRTVEELRRTKSSPLVRKIAQEHGIDITRLEGTGASGRVTKNDILSFIESGGPAAQQQQQAGAQPQPAAAAQTSAQAPAAQSGAGDRVEPMSHMRKKIAEHMVMSRRTSAHVTTVYEIDMTRIARLRDRHKAEFQQRTGTKLTFMPFIFQAVTRAVRRFPVFNSQVSGDQIVYKQDINLGMAVALDWGLIVPVIKRADDLSISGLAKAANDLADRARTKQLKPDEVAGGTFTITNPGVFGGLFGTPIINQPQVAILGVGVIEKRPKVLTTEDGDLIAIRHMAYFALSFDHRIIDGADAERFLSYVKELLEAGEFQV
jgi:pyruvate dehydrogenase E2 component (dihydrolipoamide acetyltransferase)